MNVINGYFFFKVDSVVLLNSYRMEVVGIFRFVWIIYFIFNGEYDMFLKGNIIFMFLKGYMCVFNIFCKYKML